MQGVETLYERYIHIPRTNSSRTFRIYTMEAIFGSVCLHNDIIA